jgi:hypothetical protein
MQGILRVIVARMCTPATSVNMALCSICQRVQMPPPGADGGSVMGETTPSGGFGTRGEFDRSVMVSAPLVNCRTCSRPPAAGPGPSSRPVRTADTSQSYLTRYRRRVTGTVVRLYCRGSLSPWERTGMRDGSHQWVQLGPTGRGQSPERPRHPDGFGTLWGT